MGFKTGITTEHLADGNVTTQKIAGSAITTSLIAEHNVSFSKLAMKMRKSLVETPDDINKVFTISEYITPGSEMLFKNGLLMDPGDDYTITYGEDSATVIFALAPKSTDKIFINYFDR